MYTILDALKFILRNNFSLYIIFIFSIGCGGHSSNSNEPDSACDALLLDVPSTRIINGQQCKDENVPVVKVILYDEEDNPTFCSGTLIGAKTVLTAAHCLNDFVVRAEVAMGNTIYRVLEFKKHPNYSAEQIGLINDLLLLSLDKPSSVLPMQIISPEISIEVNDEIFVYGYGATEIVESNSISSGELYGGKMKITAIDSNFLHSFYDGTLQNICFGDSGGPASIWHEGKLQLVGVVSSAEDANCASGDKSLFVNLLSKSAQDFLAFSE